MRQPRICARVAGLALAAMLASSGCATTAQRAERQQQERKAESRLNIGAEYLTSGRVALALREFLAAEKLDPENPRAHYFLSEAYLMRGLSEEAEAHFRRAIEIDPDYHDPRLSLTGLLIVEERYEEAVAECNVLIDDPTFASPWRALANRGWAEFKLGRIDEAGSTLDLALDYRSNYWPASLSLATIEVEQGQRMQAIRRYEDIIALEPGPIVESEVNYRLAQVHIALGNRRQAVGHLTTSVARAPEGRWARKSQEYLKLLH